MAQNSGFFNAVLSGGAYDRKYNADSYTNNLAVIISDGVLRSADDDLKPTANGMEINIGIGRAWIRGRWYQNDTDYNLVVPTPSPAYARKDRVFLRLDSSVAVRSITLHYAEGTPAPNPVPPAPMNTETVKDLILCEVDVPISANAVTITDTRADPAKCGWVYSVKGDDAFFKSLDSSFMDWFTEKKETLSSVTLFKQYVWRGQTETAGQKVVIFDIPQYDPTGVDIIQVYTNGILEVEGVDYLLSDSAITFVNGRTAGQEVIVVCYKSIDGTGLGSVADKVDEIERSVATLGDISDYNYICNGANDNVVLSEMVKTFANGENDGKTMTIHIYGTFGCSTPVSGSGTLDDRYNWINCGGDVYTNRKVILDFDNCSEINLDCGTNTHNAIFYGYNCHVKNFRINATETGTAGSIVAIIGTGGRCVFERCRISISAVANSYIAQRGEFNECRLTVKCAIGNAWVFNAASYSFMKVNGGEYYAYSPAGSTSSVFYVASGLSSAVIIANGASCPTVAVTGFAQSYCVYDLSANGKCAYNNIVSALNLSATSQIVQGRINQSKADFVL